MSDDERDTRVTREVADRAIQRLGVLEGVLLGLAAVGALLAGALTGWLASDALGWPFRPVWLVSSLLFFIVPGGIAWMRARRESGPKIQ